MDITMFFEFPGILITIGVVLLLLSIILLIIAFKTNDEIDASEIDAPIVNNDNKNSEKTNTDIENNTDNNKNIKDDSNNKKGKTKDTKDDEGFDLTKVFEISGDNLIEKEINKKEDSVKEKNNKSNDDINNNIDSDNDKNTDSEEIELL